MPISKQIRLDFERRHGLRAGSSLQPHTRALRKNIHMHIPLSHSVKSDKEISTLNRNGLSLYNKYPLLASRLKPSTRAKYLHAFSSFMDEVGSLPPTAIDLDHTLLGYIETKYHHNHLPGNRQKMANLISHIYQVSPELRTKLTRSQRAIRSWNKSVPHVSSLPLTKQILLAIIATLCDRNFYSTAVALSLAWGGYLRASETLSLTTNDIALAGDVRLSGFGDSTVAGVGIADAKTGLNQFTLIRDPHVLAFLSRYVQASPCGKLFSISYPSYIREIKSAAKALGISGPLTPHSARIGGALHDYCNGMAAETIAVHGRWKSISSLTYYLTNGRSFLQRLHISPSNQRLINRQATIGKSIALNGLSYHSSSSYIRRSTTRRK